MIHYRVGMPFWKLAAHARCPMRLRVDVDFDATTGYYTAHSSELDGLVVEARSLDELKLEILSAAEALLELTLHTPPPPTEASIRLRADLIAA